MRRVLFAFVATLVAATSTFAHVSPASAAVPLNPAVKPDVVMKPGDTWVKVSKDVNVGDPALAHTPEDCRTAPFELVCDVYRIKLKRNPAPDALNFVFFSLEFTPIATTPDLSAVAVGYPPVPVGDLDVTIYDEEDHRLGEDYPGGGGDVGFVLDTLATTPLKPVSDLLRPVLLGDEAGDPNDVPPGGSSFNVPERGGFTAKKDTYDIVIAAANGPQTGYTLRVGFSDEEFTTPFEVLDPEVSGSFGSDVDDKSPTVEAPTVVDSTGLPEATIDPDADIANVGLGVNGRFEAPPTISVSGARNVAATPKAPSGVVLILGLLVAPVLGMGAVVAVMRRRRQALI